MTAPLWGSVSMPPLAMAATRCSTSSGIRAACAAWMKVSDMAASAMLRASRGRSGDAGQRGHGDGLVDERVRDALQGIGHNGKSRQRSDDSAEAILGAVFMEASSEPEIAAGSFRRTSRGPAPAERDDEKNACDERAFHRPDARHFRDIGGERAGGERAPGKADRHRFAKALRNGVAKSLFSPATSASG